MNYLLDAANKILVVVFMKLAEAEVELFESSKLEALSESSCGDVVLNKISIISVITVAGQRRQWSESYRYTGSA